MGRTVAVGGVQPRSVNDKPVADTIQAIREGKQADTNSYRERSLAIHGFVCAKCAREFTPQNRHLLTVHHKDGNHHNNPPDGSNWENLCAYCHEAEHSREILGDYLAPLKTVEKEERIFFSDEGDASGLFAQRLKVALEKKKKT
ncbi:MAG: YajD family HNH nuclease [Deltaproteobacteria bacterium]|nr:YajD family HNH nuclease [Deltaproteobacteria bacterium]